MKSFRDDSGRLWDLSIGIREAKLIRARLKLNILLDADLATLTSDELTVCDLLWLLCERQATERQVSEDAFYELLVAGQTFEAVTCELIGELADFFRRMGKRMLAEICTATLTARPQAMAALERQIPKLPAKMNQMMAMAEKELETSLSTAGE